jgi:hypothetical protein
MGGSAWVKQDPGNNNERAKTSKARFIDEN